MNKIYKIIWSKVRNCYVAVSEIAKRNGKSCTSVHCGAKAERACAGMAFLSCGTKADHVHASPALSSIVGVTLLAGVCSVLLPVRAALAAPVMPTLDYRGAPPDVTIATTLDNTTAFMDISSKKSTNVLKWIDFSIGQGGTVQFDGYNYLNYVTGHNRSEIDGVLKGGGSIYLINPNGILFGSTARVDVGSLNLSTRRLTDQQLASYETGVEPLFRSDSAAVGDVINLGKLNADLIQVEGRNITFKNVADVTKGGKLTDGDITGGTPHYEADGNDYTVTLTVNNVGADPVNNVKENIGEIHLGFAVGVDGTLNGSAAEGVSAGQYTNVTVTDFAQTPSHTFNHWMTNITPTHYMLVRNGYELQNMQNNLTETNGTKMPGNYMLANDIDLQDGGSSQTNFQPIGYRNNSLQEFKFEGKFDGLNYAIKNLRIGTSSLSSDKNVACGVGLFGINAGTVENVGVDSNIAVAKPDVGGIVGINKGTIRNVYHTGNVTGAGDVGGIAGYNTSNASIELAYNTGNITAAGGYSNVGGIAGVNEGTIAQVYNTGKVGDGNTGNNVGGIAGKLAGAPPKSEETYKAKIEDAYNYNTNSTSTDSLITGSSNVGGIVGLVEGNDSDKYLVRNTYNTGIVSAENNNNGGIIGNVSSAGSGNPTVDVVSSYFSEGTPNTYSGGSENQKTIAQLQNINIFNNWSISAAGGVGTTWRIYEGQTTPLLTAFLKPKDLVKVYEYGGDRHSVVKNDPLLDDPNIKKSDQFVGNWDKDTNSVTDAGVVNILKQNQVLLYSLQNGYDIADMKLIVQPKALTATFADISKTYDGTANATAGAGTLKADDIISGDNVELNAAGIVATFADKNAGDNKTVNYTGIALSGTDANNYSIATTVTGAGTIYKKQLTVTFDPIRKTYDGTTNDVDAMGYAMPSRPGKLAGVVAGEDKKVSVTGKATYADKNVSNSSDSYDKTVYYSGLALGAGTDGDESANYVLASTAMTVVDNGRIDKANVTLTAKDVTKTYDGTTDVTGGTLVEYSGTIFASDILSGGAFAFEDKNAGKNKTVTVESGSARITDKVTGADTSGNYNITYEDNKKSTINKADVTLTAEDVTKTYDGTTSVTGGTLKLKSGTIFAGDSISGGTFAFADKNAGTGKDVTVSGVTISDGTNSGNYNITYENNTTSTINKADVTLTAENVEKTYDGTTDVAEASRKLKVKSGTIFTGDSVSGGVFAFEDKNVGTGKVVTVSDATISDGTNSGNYNITYEKNTASTINKADVTLTAEDVKKTYDGTTNVAEADRKLKVKSGTIFTGDSASGGVFAFEDKNAGENKTVTVSGATISDGTNSNNYNITYEDNTTSTINAKAITATFDAITKTYDGTTNATAGVGTLSTADIVSGDTVILDTAHVAAAYENKNAGTNKTVNYSGIALGGSDANNYSIASTATGAGIIHKADIALTAEDVTKTYDGTTNVTGGTLKVKSGTIFSGDSVSGGDFAFADKNAGTGKTVAVSGATISDGNGGNNYNVTYAANRTSTINPKVLTATFADISKTYDGTTNATAGAGTLAGLVAADAGKVSITASAAYDEKDAGSRTVHYTCVTLSGTEANNYNIASTATGSGTINRIALELVADNVTVQEGDATPIAFTGSVTGFVAGESIGSGDTLLFALADPSAKAPGSYSITGTLNGSTGGNYGLNYTFSNAASNANAFVIVANPTSVTDMTVSDLIPGIKGTDAGDIKITEMDNAMEQASDKQGIAAAGFAVSQGILTVDRDRGSSFENTGELNAAVDMVQKTDDTIGTEESKREKEAANNE